MNLNAGIINFYMLERLHYEANYVNPPFDNGESFDVKRETLRAMINAEYNRLAADLALAMRDYLFVASFGEARHAYGYCTGLISSSIPRGSDTVRHDTYKNATGFIPNKHNVDLITSAFNLTWRSSGFGGKNWAKISAACNFYSVWPAPMFIDYCVDLQHNSGSAFTKHVAGIMDVDLSDGFSLNNFLDYKRDAENVILDIDTLADYFKRPYARMISPEVRSLIRQWYAITPRWMTVYSSDVEDSDLAYKPVCWGGADLSDEMIDIETVNKAINEAKQAAYIAKQARQNAKNARIALKMARQNAKRDNDDCTPSQPETEDHRDQLQCENCERWIDEGYSYTVGDKTVCEYCHDRLVKTCHKCGDEVLTARCKRLGDFWYCFDCYNELFTECESCGEVISLNNTWYSTISECDYCEYCYGEKFATCDDCEHEGYKEDMQFTSDGIFCDDCYHEHYPECPACKEHDEEGEYTEYWCETCHKLESWCDDCIDDGSDQSSGHKLSTTYPALFTVVPSLQLTFAGFEACNPSTFQLA